MVRLTFAALLFASVSEAAIIVTFFAPSSYNSNTATMNTTLGITGYTIEDFEDTTLLSGLSIRHSGGQFAVPVTWTSLPATFDPSTFPVSVNNAWDGNNVATNLPGNSINNLIFPELTEFFYFSGTTSLGLALSNFQSVTPPSPQFPITNHELFVNGVSLGELETLAGALWIPGIVRNAYIRVDATGADSINSIAFRNISAGDALIFDHLAIAPSAASPVPEPATLSAVAAGLIAAGLLRRRRKG